MTRLLLIALIYLCGNTVQSQCSFTVNVPSDVTICSPEEIDLIGSVSGGDYINVEWVGSNGFVDDELSTNDTPQESTTYTLTAFGTTDINLVENGDFEQGNTAFTSSYLNGEIFCPTGPFNPWGNLGCEGMYVVTDDPSETHTNFSACGDHTTGDGQMMVVNGSASAINIWCQNIAVIPGTDYLFSAWATSVNAASPAILQFSINNSLIGDDFGLSGTLCAWENFNAPWNAGASSNATICITNQNTALGGNDFALDDIGFIEVCKEENSFDVTIAEVLGALPTSSNIDCDNPTVNLQVSPDTPNYTYNWEANFGGVIDGPTNQATAIATTQGLYAVTISDENGCTKKVTTSVFGSTDLPESNIVGDFQISCDQDEVSVFSTNTDSDNTYFWVGSTDNSTEPFATYDVAGNFVLQLTNEFNCTSLIPFNISNIIVQPEYSIFANDTLACIGDTVSISIDFDETPQNIQWYDPSGNPISNDELLDVGDVGYYIVEFEYANNCNFVDSVLVVSQISELDYVLGESPILNCSDTIQELSININDDFNEISWFNDTLISNDPTISVNNPGIYTVEVADDNGCITRDTVEVFEDITVADYNVESSIIDCFDGEGSLSVTTDSLVEVNWEFPDGSISNEDSINSAISGFYILSLSSPNGCVAMDTIELEANQDFPVLEVDFDSLNCNNNDGIIEITSNIGNTQYDWTGPNNFTSTESNFTVSEAGIYIYTATTESGCASSDTIEIIADFEEPVFQLTSDSISCANLIATIHIESNDNYEIIDINTADIVEVFDNSVQIGSGGITSIKIQSENGCTSTEEIQTIQNFALPQFDPLDDLTLDCNTINALVSASPLGNEEVIWFVGSDTLSTSLDLLITEEGTYNISYTHPESGCSLSDDIVVTEDLSAADFTIDANDINCINQTAFIDLNVSQEIDFVLYETDIFNQASDISYTTEESGVFEFEITYSNGCTSTNLISIDIDTISPSILAVDAMLPCTDEGVLITVDTDAPNVMYSWSGPDNFNSNLQDNNVTEAGIYEVLVTNTINGCSSSEQLEVEENQTVISSEISIEQPLCFGDLGNIISVVSEGGNNPYEFTLSDEMNEMVSPEALEAGIYFVDIIDADGCSYSEMIEIDNVEDFNIDAGSDLTISSGSSIPINATTDLSEMEIASINWTPSSGLSCSDCLNPEILNLEEDTWFYVEIENQNGCLQMDSILVRVVVAYEFYEPNIFTPNDDGVNDIFFINSNTFASNSVIREFSIYDRWGNQVFTDEDFTPNDNSHGWDGSFNGKQVISGVYAYYVSVELPDGSMENLVGSVTITR